MRKLVQGLFMCGLVCACVCAADTVTLWLPGVSETSGWTDYNKTKADTEDDNLCWAASGSNVINWWQNQYTGLTDLPPQGEEIWETFKRSVAADIGGHPFCAFQWWLTGQYNKENRNSSIAYYNVNGTGIINGTYGGDSGFDGFYPGAANGVDAFYWPDEIKQFMTLTNVAKSIPEQLGLTVAEALAAGSAATISIRNHDNGGHSITLWGAEYDSSTYDLTGLWLTDSDDEQENKNPGGLFYVGVKEETYNSNTFLIFDLESSDDWYWKGDTFNASTYYIDTVEFYHTSVSDTWGGIQRVVPEPATATLSLLAVAGLVLRRRR